MSDEQTVNKAGQIISKDIATVFEQSQVAYTTLSPNGSKACANCIFFRDTGYDGIEYQHCSIVEAYPDPILPTGICNHWEAKPEAPADMADAVAEAVSEAVVSAVETIAESMPMMTMEMDHKQKGVVQRLKDKLFPEKPLTPFTVFKGADNEWYWLARYTNNFEDRDHEIISEKALDDYVLRCDMGLIDLPELWVWHVPGTRHGKAVNVFKQEHFVYALGTFDKTPEAENARKYYEKNLVELSHGFTAPTWALEDGVYKVANTFEITTLPVLGTASNPYTEYEVLNMGNMADDPKKRPALEKVLGKEKVEQLIAHSKEDGDTIKTLARYKDYVDVNPDAETPVETLEKDTTFAKAYVETVEAQGEILKIASGMDKTLKALEGRLAAYEKEVVELRKAVNAGPRRASADDSTEVSKEKADEIKKQAPNEDDKITKGRAMLGLGPMNGGNHA